MIYYATCPFCKNIFSFDETEAVDDLMCMILRVHIVELKSLYHNKKIIKTDERN